jgi:hypothetical protein
MAQTKTKPRKRSTGGKSTGGSKKNASRSAKARKGSSTATKQKTTSKSNSSKARAQSKSKSHSGGKGSSPRSKSSARKGTAGSRRKSSQPKSGGGGRSTLEKMKVPATVAGTAMLAAAGGLAASKNGRKGGMLPGSGRKRGLSGAKSGLKSLKKIDLPKVDLSKVDLPDAEDAIDWVEEKAKGVGDAGYRVAEFSSQAQSLRKNLSGGK